MLERVREFHEKLGIPIRETPTVPPSQERSLRLTLLTEEFLEFVNAHWENDLVALADALADMAYVIYGTALSYGLPFDAVLAEVHRSNMTKGGGEPRSDGKIVKGPDYEPPQLAGLVAA